MGIVSQRLRDSAKGQECTLRIPGVCNHDNATTVLAHLPSDVKGMGTKSDDFHAVFACSDCHEAIDQHRIAAPHRYMLEALQRTIKIWVLRGDLTVAGEKERKPRTSAKTMPPRKPSWRIS